MKIFQTWKSKDPSTFTSMYSYCYGSWQDIHPDWEYQLYDDNDITEYCKLHFPQYYDDFIHLPKGILRADLVRYMFMYIEGGLYVDMDFMALKHHSDIVENAKSEKYEIIFGTLDDPSKFGYIPNAWIMSLNPRNEFWLNVLKEGFYRCSKNKRRVEAMTGPDLIKFCIYKFKPKHLLLLPSVYVYPCNWQNYDELTRMRRWVDEKRGKNEFNLPNSYAITFWNHNW